MFIGKNPGPNSPPLSPRTEQNQSAASSSQATASSSQDDAPLASLAGVPAEIKSHIIRYIPDRSTLAALGAVNKEFRILAREYQRVSMLLERVDKLDNMLKYDRMAEFIAIKAAVNKELSSGKHKAAVLAALVPKVGLLGLLLSSQSALEWKKGVEFGDLMDMGMALPYESRGIVLAALAENIDLLPREKQKIAAFWHLTQKSRNLPPEHQAMVLTKLIGKINCLPEERRVNAFCCLLEAGSGLPPKLKTIVLDEFIKNLGDFTAGQEETEKVLFALIEETSSLPDSSKIDMLGKLLTEKGTAARVDKRGELFTALRHAVGGSEDAHHAAMLCKLLQHIGILPRAQRDHELAAIKRTSGTLSDEHRKTVLDTLTARILEWAEDIPSGMAQERAAELISLIEAVRNLPDEGLILEALIKQIPYLREDQKGDVSDVLTQAIKASDILDAARKEAMLAALAERMAIKEEPGPYAQS